MYPDNKPKPTKIANFFFKYKAIFVLFIVSFTLLIIYGYFLNQRNKSFNLTIKTNPPTAKIYIDNKEQGSGNIKLNLPEGSYEILVSEQGYLDNKQTINLDKNTSLEITLQSLENLQKESVSAPMITEKVYTVITPISETSFLAFDPEERKLVKVTDNKFVTVLYSGSIASYDFGEKYLAVLEVDGATDTISVININTGIIKKLKGSELLSPISSISVSPDDKYLYIVGSYTPQTNRSIVYRSSVDEFKPVQIFTTSSTHVFALKETIIALETDGEALDSGDVQIIDTSNGEVLFESNQNWLIISNDKSKVAAILSDRVLVYDINTRKSKEFKIINEGIAAWKDNNIIVFFENTNNRTEYFYLDVRSGKKSPYLIVSDLEYNGVGSIEGIIGNTVYILDMYGKLRKINLEE